MRSAATVLIGAVLLGACGSNSQASEEAAGTDGPAEPAASVATTAAPDLETCPERAPVDLGERLRTDAIAVPAALRGVMRSNMDNFAVVTLSGGTVCVDASWMEASDNARLSPDGRFASFDWFGYEAFGHVIVDRSGKGTAIDTGAAPVASPSGKLLAASDMTESSYGAVDAFTVWEIAPAGIRLLARHQDVPAATDWKVERWSDESCVELTAIPWQAYSDPDQADDPPREPFRARRTAGWTIESGRCPAA